MGFKKETMKKLGTIEELLDVNLNAILTKAKKYDEIVEQLSNIKIRVASAKRFLDENGSVGIKIEYSIPNVTLRFDSNGKIVKNQQFIAINMLNLIPSEEMGKISLLLSNVTQQNKS